MCGSLGLFIVRQTLKYRFQSYINKFEKYLVHPRAIFILLFSYTFRTNYILIRIKFVKIHGLKNINFSI